MRMIGALSLLVLVAPVAVAQTLERRAFEEGGPENLIRMGHDSHSQLVSVDAAQGFSFTTREVYDFTVFLDEEGARQSIESLGGRGASQLLDEGRLQEAVAESPFPKLIVLSFKWERSGRDIREFLAEELTESVSRRDPGLAQLLNAFRGDFAPGDEVEIRVVGDKISMTVRGEAGEVIQSGELVTALVRLHATKRSLADAEVLFQ